jgi:hypothetical protein
LVRKLHGVALMLAEDGVGRTWLEAVRHSMARLRRMACGEAVVRVGSMERRQQESEALAMVALLTRKWGAGMAFVTNCGSE